MGLKSFRGQEKTCSICPRCEGTGRCADCGGTGQIVCPTCEGKGERVTPRGLASPCKSCAGTGKLECSTECSSCEGTGQITSDLQRKVREKYTPRYANTTPLNRASFVLLCINVGLFIFTGIAPYHDQIFALLAHPPGPFNWELWRFVTPMFLHVNLAHIVLNGSFLFYYCPPLEGLYGSRRFLSLYFFSGIMGCLVSWLSDSYGVGASGALMGVGAAYIALHYRWGFFERQEILRWTYYTVGWIALGFLSKGTSIPMLGNVDNWAHLGGFVGGFLFAWLTPRPLGR